MLKGAQKRMYVVKLGQDSMFEEAYFVLKREKSAAAGNDMISEATRIIAQSAGHESAKKPSRRWILHALLGFACGIVVGGGASALICLLL